MFRLLGCALALAALSACLLRHENFVEGQTSAPPNLDGVYEFVSESTVLQAPKRATYERTSTEWAGVWQMHNGHYTRVLMKRQRARFFEPKNLDDMGFESFAGPFEVKGESLSLTQEYAFNPFAVGRSTVFAYKVEGNTLTLTEKLYPHIEDMREGTITTVLRRMN